MDATIVRGNSLSPFATLEDAPRIDDMEVAGEVRCLLISGRQDDGLWGVIGALWCSSDGDRGGFLVNPWALNLGSEMVRSYRGALGRGFTPASIFEYWRDEVWIGSNLSVDREQGVGSLLLLNDLVAAL